jgi:aspartate 1-decarboxylase
MQRVIMKSRVHHATMKRAAVDFEGSCAMPGDRTPVIVCAEAHTRMGEQAAIA